MLAACEIAHVAVSPEGYLEIFGPLAGFENGHPPSSWVSRGLDGPGGLAAVVRSVESAEAPALLAESGDRPYLFVRRTRARLLATPFMSWSWKVEPHGGDIHPVRLIVGFYGGDPKSGSRGSQPFAFIGDPIPAFDRALELVWTADAGHLGAFPINDRSSRYAVRGGAGSTGIWWQENVDLEAVYRGLWPKDELVRVEITFVGIAVGAAPEVARARFADLALSR